MSMIPASQPSSNRLELLYHLSQTFNSSLDLNQVLNRVIDEVLIATRAERGFVMLQEPGSKLVFKVARGLDQTTIEDPLFQVSLSVVDQVAEQGRAILTSDAQTDERFSMRQSVLILGLRSILCVPLTLKEKVLGVIYVDNRIQAGIFTQSDLELLSAIASSAAIAIENARLYQVAVEKGRLEKELQMARQVQISLLPTAVPEIPGWEFAAHWLPALQVAGDFYDFIPIGSRNRSTNDQLGVVIADVAGKGMPAALFMGLARSLVRASLDRAHSAASSIARVNHLICRDATNRMFVTLFYVHLGQGNNQLTYVNAGHNPALLCQKGSAALTELTRTGRALGLINNSEYTQNTIALEPGDFILLYTDGVTDAMNANEQYFGKERLQQVILRVCELPAEEILLAIERAIQDFIGDTEPFDDVTMLVIKRK